MNLLSSDFLVFLLSYFFTFLSQCYGADSESKVSVVPDISPTTKTSSAAESDSKESPLDQQQGSVRSQWQDQGATQSQTQSPVSKYSPEFLRLAAFSQEPGVDNTVAVRFVLSGDQPISKLVLHFPKSLQVVATPCDLNLRNQQQQDFVNSNGLESGQLDYETDITRFIEHCSKTKDFNSDLTNIQAPIQFSGTLGNYGMLTNTNPYDNGNTVTDSESTSTTLSSANMQGIEMQLRSDIKLCPDAIVDQKKTLQCKVTDSEYATTSKSNSMRNSITKSKQQTKIANLDDAAYLDMILGNIVNEQRRSTGPGSNFHKSIGQHLPSGKLLFVFRFTVRNPATDPRVNEYELEAIADPESAAPSSLTLRSNGFSIISNNYPPYENPSAHGPDGEEINASDVLSRSSLKSKSDLQAVQSEQKGLLNSGILAGTCTYSNWVGWGCSSQCGTGVELRTRMELRTKCHPTTKKSTTQFIPCNLHKCQNKCQFKDINPDDIKRNICTSRCCGSVRTSRIKSWGGDNCPDYFDLALEHKETCAAQYHREQMELMSLSQNGKPKSNTNTKILNQVSNGMTNRAVLMQAAYGLDGSFKEDCIYEESKSEVVSECSEFCGFGLRHVVVPAVYQAKGKLCKPRQRYDLCVGPATGQSGATAPDSCRGLMVLAQKSALGISTGFVQQNRQYEHEIVLDMDTNFVAQGKTSDSTDKSVNSFQKSQGVSQSKLYDITLVLGELEQTDLSGFQIQIKAPPLYEFVGAELDQSEPKFTMNSQDNQDSDILALESDSESEFNSGTIIGAESKVLTDVGILDTNLPPASETEKPILSQKNKLLTYTFSHKLRGPRSNAGWVSVCDVAWGSEWYDQNKNSALCQAPKRKLYYITFRALIKECNEYYANFIASSFVEFRCIPERESHWALSIIDRDEDSVGSFLYRQAHRVSAHPIILKPQQRYEPLFGLPQEDTGIVKSATQTSKFTNSNLNSRCGLTAPCPMSGDSSDAKFCRFWAGGKCTPEEKSLGVSNIDTAEIKKHAMTGKLKNAKTIIDSTSFDNESDAVAKKITSLSEGNSLSLGEVDRKL